MKSNAVSMQVTVSCMMMLFLAACATPHREPTREYKSVSTGTAAAGPAPATSVSLTELARRYSFTVSARSAGGRKVLTRGSHKIEIDPASRVSYFDGSLVVISTRPVVKDDDLYLPRSVEKHFRALRAKPVVAKKTPRPKPIPRRKALGGRHFVIDAGHGGVDAGASRAGIREKDIALNVALEVAELLREEGARVTMTRTGDRKIPLNVRADISNRSNPDAFVSIHVNAATNINARGIEVFRAAGHTAAQRPDKISKSSKLAHAIMHSLSPVSPGRDRGVKRSPGFRVLKRNNHPAVLVELGFLSNRQERQLLARRQYQSRLARAVVDGIVNYAMSI